MRKERCQRTTRRLGHQHIISLVALRTTWLPSLAPTGPPTDLRETRMARLSFLTEHSAGGHRKSFVNQSDRFVEVASSFILGALLLRCLKSTFAGSTHTPPTLYHTLRCAMDRHTCGTGLPGPQPIQDPSPEPWSHCAAEESTGQRPGSLPWGHLRVCRAVPQQCSCPCGLQDTSMRPETPAKFTGKSPQRKCTHVRPPPHPTAVSSRMRTPSPFPSRWPPE